MCQEGAEKVQRTCIAERMSGKCAENVHCAGLCIIYMTVPSKNSSPSSNSIPNSILSLRFLSLGTFLDSMRNTSENLNEAVNSLEERVHCSSGGGILDDGDVGAEEKFCL